MNDDKELQLQLVEEPKRDRFEELCDRICLKIDILMHMKEYKRKSQGK